MAYLRERLRAGDLDPERVRLAAWLGHPAAERAAELRFEVRNARARDALAGLVQAPELIQGTLARWGDGLIAFGSEVALRAALADARRCVTAIARSDAEEELASAASAFAADASASATWRRVFTEATDAAVRWLLAPTPESVDAARVALRRRTDPGFAQQFLSWGPSRTRQDWIDLDRAAWVLTLGVEGQRIDDWWHYRRPDEGTGAVARYRAVRAALREEVLPWALGWRDPLHELPRRALDALVSGVDALDVATPCGAAWDDMPVADRRGAARTCAACSHRVYDVSAMRREEVEALLREHEGQRLCVRFYRREDGRVVTSDCPVGLEARIQGATVRPRPLMGIRAR